ncbi:hypothetical protein GCM10009091_49330 [Pseudomonas brenneri]|uniref:hypothetical protein n=1 Tax=Pseudomonas brenneri TaxID=129817 RepID=UPI0012FE7D56|nr:hypothetical protein [Pseudomonas brenneri]GGL61752.1 hypothetical protein GCM10009091_49330 [Pseudomonas brenneri]
MASSRYPRLNGWKWPPSALKKSPGDAVRQLSQRFDAPQYAEQFIELARKTTWCRDMQIRAKAVLMGAKGKPIINATTKTLKIGWADYAPSKKST